MESISQVWADTKPARYMVEYNIITLHIISRWQADLNDEKSNTWTSPCNFQTQERFPVKEVQILEASEASYEKTIYMVKLYSYGLFNDI
jgi:hypothetical protein